MIDDDVTQDEAKERARRIADQRAREAAEETAKRLATEDSRKYAREEQKRAFERRITAAFAEAEKACVECITPI